MKFKTRDLIIAAFLLALGVLLPTLFHLTGLNGKIFSPIHIPALLAGFILGPTLGLIVGILSPVLGFFVSSMPMPPFLWTMMVELALYGLVAGILYKNLKGNVYLSLIGAMIVGRLGGALTALVLANLFNIQISAKAFLTGATIAAWPAIILQLVLIPIIVRVYNQGFANNQLKM